ncbi:hypothetical protein PR048_011635 [Dryococelus australis]|uniref:DUF4371 domain-containing protein n=1 Tax=Dryococelus australis TaxID=614101 RepID=A0ABQ9HM60_9NEOP|nr:hypothetical protein PR048_011635 [Dryococelus australis]
MLETVCEEYPKLKERISRRYGHYSFPEYQNDLIYVNTLRILRCITEKAKEAGFYSIMADETKDVSKMEQLAILIRYRAIGLHHLKYCSEYNISNAIFSLLSEQGLDEKYCVGQCYNGVNVMSGWANGVQARVKHQAPHAIYFYCHAHHLNLVLVHSLSVIDETNNFFLPCKQSTASYQIAQFDIMSKILKNFEAILIVLDEGMEDRAESIGIRAQMEQQRFIFLLYALELVIGITYSLAQQLQSKEIDFVAAGFLIKSTKEELATIRSSEKCDELDEKAKTLTSNSNIEWEAVAKTKRALTSRLTDSVVFTSVGQMERNTRSLLF